MHIPDSISLVAGSDRVFFLPFVLCRRHDHWFDFPCQSAGENVWFELFVQNSFRSRTSNSLFNRKWFGRWHNEWGQCSNMDESAQNRWRKKCDPIKKSGIQSKQWKKRRRNMYVAFCRPNGKKWSDTVTNYSVFIPCQLAGLNCSHIQSNKLTIPWKNISPLVQRARSVRPRRNEYRREKRKGHR